MSDNPTPTPRDPRPEGAKKAAAKKAPSSRRPGPPRQSGSAASMPSPPPATHNDAVEQMLQLAKFHTDAAADKNATLESQIATDNQAMRDMMHQVENLDAIYAQARAQLAGQISAIVTRRDQRQAELDRLTQPAASAVPLEPAIAAPVDPPAKIADPTPPPADDSDPESPREDVVPGFKAKSDSDAEKDVKPKKGWVRRHFEDVQAAADKLNERFVKDDKSGH